MAHWPCRRTEYSRYRHSQVPSGLTSTARRPMRENEYGDDILVHQASDRCVSKASVRTVLCGSTQRLGRTTSAIFKRPVGGAVQVGALGLVGDSQADRRVHGGVDKAVHCYAWAHYATWRSELPSCSAFAAPGAFGENLSIDGLDEQTVCIGDVWRVGKTVLAVTQGRQPCFKLNL